MGNDLQDQMRKHVYSFEDKAERQEAAKSLVAFASSLVAELRSRFQMEWFDEFWAAYPRRVGKAAAFRKYRAIICGGTDPKELLEGARRYAHSVRDKEKQYTAHPTTWLNAGRWEDELEAATLPQEIQDRLIRDEAGRFYYRQNDERVYV